MNSAARKLLWPFLFTCVSLAVLIWLGLWQLDRRDWKQALMTRLQDRMAEAPLTLPPDTTDRQAFEYRRLSLTGEVIPDSRAFLVGRSYRGVSGYDVFEAVRVESGRALVVNRGWIDYAGKSTLAAWGDGAVSLSGSIRWPRSEPEASPPPENREYFGIDIARMARAAGLEPDTVSPYYLQITELPETGGTPNAEAPKPRPVEIDLPDKHLQYALTWFGLAGVLIVIFLVFARRLLRGSS